MKTKKDKITKDMTIGEAVSKYPETAKVMMKHGMHCCGCSIAGMETIEQGAMSHGIDIKKLLKDMNKAVTE
jgi:hybrid cluster-associated redox disulfide protein